MTALSAAGSLELHRAPHPSVRKPKVSIIIPTCNRSALLPNAIESALQQTYQNCEIIVVNDGSTDDTAAVLASYGDRIRYICQRNQGIAAALNRGIEAADGQWIAVLADDDVWLPAKLESQINALDALGDSFGACFTNCIYDGDPARTLSTFEEARLNCRSDFGPLDDALRCVLAKRPALFVQSMVVSRSLLRESNGFDEKLVVGEDTDLLFRLAFCTRFCIVSEPLVKIDRTPSLPRLTDLYESESETMLACVDYRYRKWLQLPELTDPAIRQTVQEHLRSIYYARTIKWLYKSNLSGGFEYIQQLRKTGVSFPRIFATLLFRAARKLFFTLAGGTKHTRQREAVSNAGASSSPQIVKSSAIIGGSNGLV